MRVLVVDDQPVFRRSAVALVRAAGGFEVVGEAASGEQAVREAARLRPDAVLMDVRLPGIDGIDATRLILSARPGTTVVLVSTCDAADLPDGLATCGAAAFLRKQDLDPVALSRAFAGIAS